MLWASDLHRLPPHPDTEHSPPTLPGPALGWATGWGSDILGARHFTVDRSHLPQLPLPCTSQVRILTASPGQGDMLCTIPHSNCTGIFNPSSDSTTTLLPNVGSCVYLFCIPCLLPLKQLGWDSSSRMHLPTDTLFLKSWKALKTRCAGMLRPMLLWRSNDSSQTYTSQSQ